MFKAFVVLFQRPRHFRWRGLYGLGSRPDLSQFRIRSPAPLALVAGAFVCTQPRAPGLLLASFTTPRLYCVHFDRSLTDIWLSLPVHVSRWYHLHFVPLGGLSAFLASSDGALVSRLRELSTGLLFITSIPGEAHSGAIYFYSSVRRAFVMLDWAVRDDDFDAAEFDVLVHAFPLDLALAPGACPATRHRSRRHGRYNQRHPRITGGPAAYPATHRSNTAPDSIDVFHRKEDSRCPRARRSHPGGNRQPPPRGFSRLPRIGQDVYEALRESAVLLLTIPLRGPSLPPPQAPGA